MFSVKSFFVQCARVWKILRKPTSEEFKTTAKVSLVGYAIIGLLGFLISIIMNLLSL